MHVFLVPDNHQEATFLIKKCFKILITKEEKCMTWMARNVNIEQ